MESYRHPKRKFFWPIFWVGGVGLPLLLVALFYGLQDQPTLLLWWTEKVLTPVAHTLGRICSVVPFSVGEIFLILFGLYLVFWLCYRGYRCVGHREAFLRKGHLAAICTLLLWVWVLLSWMWNVLYYVPSFTQRSGLDVSPYPVEDLVAVTQQFAQRAKELSTQVPRDEALHFDVDQGVYFENSVGLYQQLEVDYPFIAMEAVKPKPLVMSTLQSWFGFTGAYSPFTGEANINTDTPRVLHPATIAHEMAHQRMVAPELEANFLAVVACLDSDDLVFQYSGALLGLMELSSALYSVDPEGWQQVVNQSFTPELATDWQDNGDYWSAFQSSSDNVAKDVYDSFLKGNDQELGIRSYGACVDLLVAYYK